MSVTIEFQEQQTLVNNYLSKRYSINFKSYSDYDDFLKSSLKGILSLKLWRDNIQSSGDIHCHQHLNEIISDLNQILILNSIGFVIPSLIVLRRSYDNYSNFLYFKDHQVEFFIKEQDKNKKHVRSDELQQYFEKYPFQILNYEECNYENCEKLIKDIMNQFFGEYGRLSKYVHASNSQFLGLKEHLDNIEPKNDNFNLVSFHMKNYNSIINASNILFFNNIYKSMDVSERSFIRSSISPDKKYKKQLRNIFGYI